MNLEKFAKEIEQAEKRASIHLGHVALSDIKTLDGLLKKAISADKSQKKAGALDNRFADLDYEAQQEFESSEIRLKDSLQDVEQARKEANKIMETAEKRLDMAREASQDASNDYTDTTNAYLKANAEWGNEMDAAFQVANQLQQAIKGFNTAAKALGVDVKGLTDKYVKAFQNIMEYHKNNNGK